MRDVDLEQIITSDHQAAAAFCLGDPEPKKRLYSHRDDVTLANPLGPPARGWPQVAAVLDHAASLLRDGAPPTFERISEYETTDLAYIVEIERTTVKVGGANDASPVSLRATTIYRREQAGWRVVHRHADPITAPSPAQSVVTGKP